MKSSILSCIFYSILFIADFTVNLFTCVQYVNQWPRLISGSLMFVLIIVPVTSHLKIRLIVKLLLKRRRKIYPSPQQTPETPPLATIQVQVQQQQEPRKQTQEQAIYYFITLTETCLQTLPSLFVHLYVISVTPDVNLLIRKNVILCVRLLFSTMLVGYTITQFYVWRNKVYKVVPASKITMVMFKITFILYIIERIGILALLLVFNPILFVQLAAFHILFGICHSLDEFTEPPFGHGNLLTSVEKKLYNCLTLLVLYPIINVISYLKILNPSRWWSVFFFVVVFFEHSILFNLYGQVPILYVMIYTVFSTFVCLSNILYTSIYFDKKPLTNPLTPVVRKTDFFIH